MPAIAGLRGTGQWGADERPTNFEEMILWMNPNGESPITALSDKFGGRDTTDDPMVSWWTEPQDLVRLRVNGALTDADTLVAVDSTDPSAGDLRSHWGTALNLVPGDILMVEPAADNVADTWERVVVVAVHSATSFTIARGAAGTTAAAIADNAHLLHVGSAYAEGTKAPTSTSRNPVKYSNYTQIFKTTYELTGTAEQTNIRTGDPVENDKKRAAFDHGKKLETALLFGKKSEGVGANGKPLRTMGGLTEFIPAGNRTILAPNWGLLEAAAAGNSLLEAITPVFEYASQAGDERIAFCGNGALSALNIAIFRLSGTGAAGQITWDGMEKTWGMNFRRLLMPQGTIALRTHPLLNRHPMYRNSMFIIDPTAIKMCPMRNRDTKFKDNVQDDDEDVRRGFWQTETTMKVYMGGETMGYIGGFNNSPAAT